MKTLKFKKTLADLILKGEKTCTWRFFDDKNISFGDHVMFIIKDTGQEFGEGIITQVLIKKFEDINDDNCVGHEKFSNKEDMLSTYRNYYNTDKIDWESEIKVIRFIFTPRNG